MRRPMSLFIGLTLATSTHGGAQVVPDSGQRVRVHYGAGKVVIGVLDSISAGSLYVRESAASRSHVIPRAELRLIERSLGRHRNFWSNFATTFAISAVAVGALSAITFKPCEGSLGACFYAPESEGDAFIWGLAGGAILGLPLGLIIGASFTSERWAPRTLPATSGTTLRLSPVFGSRIGIIGTLRFGGGSS